MAVVRILGIDPGTQVVGFGCLELRLDEPPPPLSTAPLALRAANVVRAGGSDRVDTVDCGVLKLGRRQHDLPERLWSLSDQFRQLLERLQPHELALEEAFYGKSVQAALRIGEARGVVLAEAARMGLAIHQYPPARIKQRVTGRGGAGKEAVADMVWRQLGREPPSSLPADASDALAAALCRLEERRSPLLLAARDAAGAASDRPVAGAPGDGAGTPLLPSSWGRPRRRR